MEKKLIGTNEIKSKMQEIVSNQTDIDITLKESDKIVKDFFEYIKTEVCDGNEVLINNFGKLMLKKYRHPQSKEYYDHPVIIFSTNFFRKDKS